MSENNNQESEKETKPILKSAPINVSDSSAKVTISTSAQVYDTHIDLNFRKAVHDYS